PRADCDRARRLPEIVRPRRRHGIRLSGARDRMSGTATPPEESKMTTTVHSRAIGTRGRLALAALVCLSTSAAFALPQSKPAGKPGDKRKDGAPAKDGKDASSASTPEDRTYKNKAAHFQITAPADKTWDVYADENSKKKFLLPVYQERC